LGVFEDSVATFLAPVQKYLQDDSVSEVLVNGPAEVFIERKGLLERVPEVFKDEQALQAAIRNIAQFVGRRIDEENPILDARLPDGSRVAAILSALLAQRRDFVDPKIFQGQPDLRGPAQPGSISKDAARFLDVCIYLAKNIIISGGTGSGKTTLLNVLGSRIPGAQRLLIIEDSSELKINTDHVVFFETPARRRDGQGPDHHPRPDPQRPASASRPHRRR